MSQSPHSESVTEGIRIHAAAQFLPERSGSGQSHSEYVYRITMTNVGKRAARLLARHWIIIDADRHREDVRGPGVVGEFPRLEPGQSYSYMSRCPLRTRWGTMEGSYTFERDDGERFRVRIGRFFLVPSAPPLEQSVH